MREGSKKYGKPYTAEEIAFFQQYRDNRAALRPRQCNRGERCWVERGPPAFRAGNAGECIGCDGTPKVGSY